MDFQHKVLPGSHSLTEDFFSKILIGTTFLRLIKKNFFQKSMWPRGKMLGGCSSLNYLFYVRGDPRDFNYWQEQFGLEGWGYEDILPYFLRAENYQEKYINRQSHPL